MYLTSYQFLKIVGEIVENCKINESWPGSVWNTPATLLQSKATTGKVLDGRKTTNNLLVEVLGLVQSTSGCLLAVQNLKRWYETLGASCILQTVHLRWGSARKRFGGGNRKKQSLETVAELFSSLQTSKPSPPLLPHPKQCCGGF